MQKTALGFLTLRARHVIKVSYPPCHWCSREVHETCVAITNQIEQPDSKLTARRLSALKANVMKTIHSRILSALAILSTAILLPGANAQTASTVPVGFMSLPLTLNQTTAIGLPLLETATFSGPVGSFTTNTITVSGATWTLGQFATPGSPFMVTIRTGLQAGRTLLVIGNTTDTLTLQTNGTGLDAASFSIVTGATSDTFELFPGETLGTLFGTVATSGVLPSGIQGGGNSVLADGVQIYNGVKFVTYFFNTTLSKWVMVNGGTADQKDTILYPDDGLLIARRGPTSSLTLLGRVPDTKLLTELPNGSTNAVSVRFPTDTTLAGLIFSGPGSWTMGNSVVADTVNLWNGIKWVPYYKNAGGVWNMVNGGSFDQGATTIPAGSAILILKRGTANSGAATFLSQALPYSVN